MDNLKKDESFLFEKLSYLKDWRTELNVLMKIVDKNKVEWKIMAGWLFRVE